MKKTILITIFVSLTGLAFGQGVMTPPETSFKTVNGFIYPNAGATVTVCAGLTGGIPCSPPLVNAIFKDAALSQPLSNPFTADSSGGYQFAAAPGNYTVTETAPGFQGKSYQLTLSPAASTAGVPTFPDPTTRFFGRTNIDLLNNGVQSGDPQVVFDSANNQWVMFWYQPGGGTEQTWEAVSTSIYGPWTGVTNVTSLNNVHKLRVLVDVNNNVIKLNNKFYAIGVSAPTTKQVLLFSQSTLQGNAWFAENSGNPVVPKSSSGGAGIYDDFMADSPEFLYDANSGNCYIWYTGAPTVSQSDFGLAERVLLAIATSVTGPYVKQSGYVLGPSSSAGWDFGLVEGVQVRAKADGTLFMAYIGGSVRPSSAGAEPTPTLWGFASAPAFAGPWTKSPGPYIQLSGLPQYPTGVPNSGSVGTVVDSTSIWRPYCLLDGRSWIVYYNTGNASSPTEKITYARQGVLSFANGAYVGGLLGSGGYILQITTSEQQIPGSQVFLRPGKYHISFTINMFADLGGTNPKLDIALFVRPNGTKAGQWTDGFVGSYAFENDDFAVDDYIIVPAPAGPNDTSQFVDSSLLVRNGTPTSQTYARNLRVLIEQIN